jgi:acetyltransferase-like isoleucine patch superfamily enzyme
MFRVIKDFYRRLLYNQSFFPVDRSRIVRELGVQVGEGCRILAGLGAFGSEPYLIRIGNHCEITSGVRLITHDGATWIFRHRPDWHDGINRFGKIDIRDNCFIGVNAIILPGVTIGPNSIVGAGAVVTRDVPPDSIAVGNPARVVGSVDDYFARCCRESVPGLTYRSLHARNELITHFWGSL